MDLVSVNRAFDDDVLSHSKIEPHLIILGRESAPVFTQERGRGFPILAGALDEDANLSILKRGFSQMVSRVILQHIVHRHPKLVLGAVDVIEFEWVASVCFLNRYRLISFDQHFLSLIQADRFFEMRSKTSPDSRFAEYFVGKVLE